jgi:hypothetical protein
MNKYLLLRDNKQSGPYTVPEIITKGIKPYDLVWLEGKSAAWRYPSEVEELKAYAPAVEEQPFDRFFKKPELIQETAKSSSYAAQQSRYEPQVSVDTMTEEAPESKKIYINFPGNGLKQAKPEIKKEIHAESVIAKEIKKEPVVNFPERVPITEINEEMPSWKSTTERNYMPVNKREDKKLLYGAFVVCFILIAFVGVLLVNYNKQQQTLKELNTIVRQMERDKTQEQNVPAAATLVNHDVPAEQTSETIVNPEALNITTEKPVVEKTSDVPKKPGKNRTAPAIVFSDASVVDHEPLKTDIEKNKELPKITASENLFKLVTVKPNKYKTGLLGGISNLQLELTNNSLRELQKVAIEIKYLGPEKKVVKKQTVYFENVSPGGQTTIDVPRSNRGVSIDYTITDIKS